MECATPAWVQVFYECQAKWSDCYSGPVAAHHREKIAGFDVLTDGEPKRVLELGAGGGQHAAACAELGHDVVAIELVPALAAKARKLGQGLDPGKLMVLTGDFYEIDPGRTFDVITYWDGFGIGCDEDQRRLLGLIRTWLSPDGCALIDVYSPSFFSKLSGTQSRFGSFSRCYGFDTKTCRLLDRWWPTGRPEEAVEQSLRCYSLEDIHQLVTGSGLSVTRFDPDQSPSNTARIVCPSFSPSSSEMPK